MELSTRRSYAYAEVDASYNFLEIANTMSNYQLFFLAIDVICNLTIDSTSTDPMTGLIVLLIQVLTLFVNFVSVVMMSSHKGIKGALERSNALLHNLSTLTIISYLILTISWHVWALRRSWPAASDQFSYSFLPKGNDNASDALPFGPGFDHLKEDREFYMLWSPGFIGLYTCHRTVASLYYAIHLQSIFFLVNVGKTLSALSAEAEMNRVKDLKMRTISALVENQSSRFPEQPTNLAVNPLRMRSASGDYFPAPQSRASPQLTSPASLHYTSSDTRHPPLASSSLAATRKISIGDKYSNY